MTGSGLEPLPVVVVTTKAGYEIRGLLREEGSNGFVLVDAAQSMAGPNGQTAWKPLLGEVVIPLSNVDYYQRALPVSILSQIGALDT